MNQTTLPQTLPEDYALVLQHIQESGEEDFVGLSRQLHITRQRLAYIIEALKQKHLILLDRKTYAASWIRLSTQGKRLVMSMWPESTRLSIAS